jgi:Protein kinase domain/ECF sigma factor
MHWLIVDHVRERRARKRGGELHGTELTTAIADSVPQDSGALARLHDALEALSRTDAPASAPVDLKFFCGLSFALLGRGGAERFRREGSALARLMHPNVAHLIDAGLAAGYAYVVLEYVDRAPIDRWRDGRRLDLAARIRLVLQVLAAVSHAHGKLILHRDLKPSNILVTPEGQIKLLDRGVRSKRAGGRSFVSRAQERVDVRASLQCRDRGTQVAGRASASRSAPRTMR